MIIITAMKDNIIETCSCGCFVFDAEAKKCVKCGANRESNTNEKAQIEPMKNEPKVIYLNCYDEAEMDKSYLPIDNDFDSLDTEFVLWSAEHPCLGGHIKYIHHSEVDALQSRIDGLVILKDHLEAKSGASLSYIAELQQDLAKSQEKCSKYESGLEQVVRIHEIHDGKSLPVAWESVAFGLYRIAEQALKPKEDEKF